MIPEIGIMVGAYIFLRCLEILASTDRVKPSGWRAALNIAGVLVLLIAAYGIADLAMRGDKAAIEMPAERGR